MFPRPTSQTSDHEVFVDSLSAPTSRLLSTSMEEMPPPPPSGDSQEDADVELPPPPPEVLLEEKQNVTLGNGRDRSTSGGKTPPVVKPKPVRPRNGSTGVPGQPRTSSSSGNT